ncbi:cytidylyltransferase family-domain-containing protein [Mycotypha africana]|uniref:cytidylyltransferase family-domain-containing protein n=1 Tax=Mycotypha africana TaxID=64632 RepID=UPI00230016BF|nr:cytidylyltransferase family-domain-containing protein [Mycotypha africana]KAI8977424.1 cytidylyltransferase family-domain-containing protein [Mycotypha africana]
MMTKRISSMNDSNRSTDTTSVVVSSPLPTEAVEKVTLLADESSQKKWKNWWLRTTTTFMMIGAFFAILASGHIWVILMVIAISTSVYNEVLQIAQVPAKDSSFKWFKTMSWYFLVTTAYFLYGESIIYYFQHVVLVDRVLLPFATHHRFISFVLYVIGFVFFVMNLQTGQYKRQFRQFGWMHMALLLIVFQSHFIVNNILEGLIWFFLPASLVICNDIFAYVCGFFWGKHQLIQLSPKKTIEGFVGAWFCTLIFGFLWSTLLMRFNYLICPVKDLSMSAWSNTECNPINPVFTAIPFNLPTFLTALLKTAFNRNVTKIWIAPIQLHSIAMACFASLIAPFGGFFASGVKRAFNVKDFGQSIPGHGGMTDRMDCQFLMGFFSYIYYQSFIKTYNLSIGSILAAVINNLTLGEQLELSERILTYLVNQGLVDAGVLHKCGPSALTTAGLQILNNYANNTLH